MKKVIAKEAFSTGAISMGKGDVRELPDADAEELIEQDLVIELSGGADEGKQQFVKMRLEFEVQQGQVTVTTLTPIDMTKFDDSKVMLEMIPYGSGAQYTQTITLYESERTTEHGSTCLSFAGGQFKDGDYIRYISFNITSDGRIDGDVDCIYEEI